jgi:tetratricopeptide (TPR) repeat protein
MELRHEPRHWIARADAAVARGDLTSAIEALQRCASLYAARGDDDSSLDREQGETCRRLAILLSEAGKVPEAIQAYQEAADSFGRVPGAEDEARACAREILAGVRRLWEQPRDRLYLLIARLEREERQLSLEEGSEQRRADLLFRIGTILQRRDRFSDAEPPYLQALTLYDEAAEAELKRAECHQRLAGLYHHELGRLDAAADHYEAAIRLFREHEPLSEGEQMNRALCEMLLDELVSLKADGLKAEGIDKHC